MTLRDDTEEARAEQRRRLRLALEGALGDVRRRRKVVRWGALACALAAALATGVILLAPAAH